MVTDAEAVVVALQRHLAPERKVRVDDADWPDSSGSPRSARLEMALRAQIRRVAQSVGAGFTAACALNRRCPTASARVR